MRILLAFLLMFVCASARAATMCVPDLSTCESCTYLDSDGPLWEADCCGVRVTGTAIMLSKSTYQDGVDTISQSLDDFNYFSDGEGTYCSLGGTCSLYCVMASPVRAEYAVIVSSYVASGVSDCANYFIPKCALTMCTDKIEASGVNPYQ